MRVLVTGGAGYIGSTLSRVLLEGGHHVRVFDNLTFGGQGLLSVWSHPGFEFQHGDIRDDRAVEIALAQMDAVVHLAAIVGDPACSKNPDLARDVNLDASLRLIDRADRAGVSRFVFASTCSNYGKMTDPEALLDETAELRPVSLYAETKVAIERALLDGSAGQGLCATALRLATIFGTSPRMRFDLTVNEFTFEMLTGRRLVVFGEQFWRPYVHVRDAARAMAAVLASPADRVHRQVFNVGSTDQNYRKKELVDLIAPYAPDAVVEYVHRDEDPRDYRVRFDRIRATLGFETTRTVEDGIREIVQMVGCGMIRREGEAACLN